MDLKGNAFPLKLLRRAVLLVSVALMFYQIYQSLAEYQKREYVQVPEDSTLSQVTLPRIVVCNEQGFKEKVSTSLFAGMHPIYSRKKPLFFGWGKENMTTKDHLESMVTLKHKNQLLFRAKLAESIVSLKRRTMEDQKLRISYPDGQCYSIKIPQNESNKTKYQLGLVISLHLADEANAKIYLQDPNNFNGYTKP